MLLKYQPAIAEFSSGVARALSIQLNLNDKIPLWDALVQRGLGQADVVLTLLRLTLLPEVEALVGHPIKRLPARPPAERLYIFRQPEPVEKPGDERVIHYVARNPRLPTTDSFQRYKYLTPGLTLGAAVRRGATRKDLRQAFENKWLVTEDMLNV